MLAVCVCMCLDSSFWVHQVWVRLCVCMCGVGVLGVEGCNYFLVCHARLVEVSSLSGGCNRHSGGQERAFAGSPPEIHTHTQSSSCGLVSLIPMLPTQHCAVPVPITICPVAPPQKSMLIFTLLLYLTRYYSPQALTVD